MKKLLTLGNIIKAGAVLFGLIAFFMMFTNQAYVELLGNKSYVEFADAFFKDGGSPIGFVGYLLVLLAALAVCAFVVLPLFVKIEGKLVKIINLALAFVLLLGAIFILVEAAAINGVKDTEAYHLAAGPIVGGIFGIVSALAVAASEFIPQK